MQRAMNRAAFGNVGEAGRAGNAMTLRLAAAPPFHPVDGCDSGGTAWHAWTLVGRSRH